MNSSAASLGVSRTPTGVRLASLARGFARLHGGPVAVLGDEGAPEWVTGQGLLEALARGLGLDALAWVQPGRDPVVGGRGHGLRAVVQSMEWPLLVGIPEGGCVDLRPDSHPGSGRMRAFEGYGFMARSAHGGDGTLVGLAALPVHGSRARWPQLAEWVCVSFMAEEEQRLDLAQERERRLGRQTAALNHDLRNHLNLASMQLERLRLEGPSPRERESGGPGDGAVNLADLSRSLGNARDLCAGSVVGQDGLARRRLQLRPRLLAQSRAARELSGCGETVRVLVRCRGDLVVRGHPSHLDRLIKNLVLNAIEASPSGGEVRLGARIEEGAVHLEVLDGGRGMDAAALAQWMRPGQSGRGGTGYGSASLQECLDGLGGEMDVASAPGKGTRISVRLPAAHGSRSALVLLLEPSAQRREIRRAAFARQGLSVVEAGSVEDARTWLGDPALKRVILPRGLRDAGLPDFMSAAERAGVDVQCLGVMRVATAPGPAAQRAEG